MSCKKQTTKRYTERPSPPFPANECCGGRRKGNDGKFWRSVEASNGVCRWVRDTGKTRGRSASPAPRRKKAAKARGKKKAAARKAGKKRAASKPKAAPTSRPYVPLSLVRNKAKRVEWQPSQPLLSLSLAKHPDPRARALKGIEVRAGPAGLWDWRVKAGPVKQSYVVAFDAGQSVSTKRGSKTAAHQYPIRTGAKKTERASQEKLADKLGGYPWFVQQDMWEDAKNPASLVNLVTWQTERLGGNRAMLWAGDGTVLNVWMGPGRGLHLDAAMH